MEREPMKKAEVKFEANKIQFRGTDPTGHGSVLDSKW